MSDQPIVVSANAGLIDSIQAIARYAVVIVGFVTAMLALFKVHDIAGMIAYIQANGGQTLGAVSGIIAIGTAAYGVFKSRKRAAQLVAVASDPAVPETTATLK